MFIKEHSDMHVKEHSAGFMEVTWSRLMCHVLLRLPPVYVAVLPLTNAQMG